MWRCFVIKVVWPNCCFRSFSTMTGIIISSHLETQKNIPGIYYWISVRDKTLSSIFPSHGQCGMDKIDHSLGRNIPKNNHDNTFKTSDIFVQVMLSSTPGFWPSCCMHM